MTEKDIILLRLEVLKLCYNTHSMYIKDTIEKAKIIESYVMGNYKAPDMVAPEKDKVSPKKKA